ncbi:MAG: hypothetical protein ACRDQA_02805 [Nocardioidaceae bacterium]
MSGDNTLFKIARLIETTGIGPLDCAIVAQLRRTASDYTIDPIFYHREYELALEMGACWLVEHITRGEDD